jgi:outer membrane protein assembly factor BamB
MKAQGREAGRRRHSASWGPRLGNAAWLPDYRLCTHVVVLKRTFYALDANTGAQLWKIGGSWDHNLYAFGL